MSYAVALTTPRTLRTSVVRVFVFPLRLFHWWVNLPTVMFLLVLTAMLFRPPDLKAFPIDRVTFLALILLVCVRVLLRCERLQTYPATWPLLALFLLGLWGALTQPYDPQVWSVFAAKCAVPFVCFHAAGSVFQDERSRRLFEIFLLSVLFYLSAISVFSLLNANALIFPKFITNEGIGIHSDRARGPFLQAVANGVCLNLLGLIALDSFRRRKLPRVLGMVLFLAVPVAILATKTRAVWISAAVSALVLVWFGSAQRIRRVALTLSLTAILAAGISLIYHSDGDSFAERLLDRSPVDFRTEMYRAGWGMFTEKPLIGWGNESAIQPEIEKRISSFHLGYYVFHNTFLELLVQRGLLGLALYAWLMICLFCLGKTAPNRCAMELTFSHPHFRALWPLLLAVYLLNASAVVMNYQFVNALLFTIAGILAADAKRFSSADPIRYEWPVA